MGTIIGEGITFDDVLLVPAYSEVIPNQVDCLLYTSFVSLPIVRKRLTHLSRKSTGVLMPVLR